MLAFPGQQTVADATETYAKSKLIPLWKQWTSEGREYENMGLESMTKWTKLNLFNKANLLNYK